MKLAIVCGACLLLASWAVAVQAQSMPPQYMPDAVGALSIRGPLRLAEQPETPVYELSPVTVDEPDAVAKLRAWNAAGREPLRSGVVRTFLKPVPLVASVRDGVAVGSAAIRVAAAEKIRLRLKGVEKASAMWVWGADGRAIPFGIDSCTEDGCWSPSVAGEIVFFESQGAVSASAAVDAVADAIVGGPSVSAMSATGVQAAPSCFLDATCVTTSTLSNIADYRRAVATLDFADSTGEYLCTGALINNGTTPQPLLLTANHCISNATRAASLEAYFDFRSASCGGAAPSFSTLPRSIGSTLLSTSSVSDYSLVRLNTLPAGRYLLGWDANSSAASVGTRLYRISHPAASDGSGIYVQAFSSTTVSSSALCSGLSRPSFLGSTLFQGATDHGSSGSPTINSGGYIVGQLFGACIPVNSTDPCVSTQLVVDGAFSQTYPSIANILNPSTSCSACVPNSRTACALGGRFKVTLRWHDNVSGANGTGALVKYAENTPATNPTYGILSEMIYFSFYPDFPNSVEVVAKMVKGVGINNQFWAFATSVNNSEYWVDIVDTQSCRTWTGHQPFGQLTTIADFSAFPFP